MSPAPDPLSPLKITFRPATLADFDYCARLYMRETERTAPELDIAQVRNSLTQRWDHREVRIIALDGIDVGWVQTVLKDDTLFLRQFMIEESFQRRGIGTAVLQSLIGEATRDGRAMTLGVVKTNPARALYDRHGFRVTHDDERKFYMRREIQPL